MGYPQKKYCAALNTDLTVSGVVNFGVQEAPGEFKETMPLEETTA